MKRRRFPKIYRKKLLELTKLFKTFLYRKFDSFKVLLFTNKFQYTMQGCEIKCNHYTKANYMLYEVYKF